ncbi:MAG: hypothetical protein ABJB86_15845 [Bacteroidota bacterium]
MNKVPKDEWSVASMSPERTNAGGQKKIMRKLKIKESNIKK